MSSFSLASAQAARCHQPFIPALNHKHFSSSISFSAISFRILPSLLPRKSRAPIKACFQRSRPEMRDERGKMLKFHVNPLESIFWPIKATFVTTITAAALFFSQFHFLLKPAVSAPVSPPSAVETSVNDEVVDVERERFLEAHLLSNPNDTDGLKDLMEIKIKSKKIPESIVIIEKLIELEPHDNEWPMLKAHLYAYSGDTELAKNEFSELLEKDPLSVEAYHGLVTVASQEDSTEDLENVEKRVEEAVKLCKKENKKSDMRDFKLLLAQIQVLEGKYDTALEVYQELVKEEPKDFRPYLCQGIIYTLLKKNNEAEKSFEKYRRLVPKGHPYASYFDDNMMATKIFAQKAENERAISKS